MAKYEFNYACNHGKGTITLFGKGDQRRSKLAWHEQHTVCPECYRRKKLAEDAAAEQRAVLKMRVGKVPYFSLVLYGKTYENKELLKSLGFRWEDDHDTALQALLGSKSPQKAWQKVFPAANMDELVLELNNIGKEIAPLGYRLESPNLPDLDLALLSHQWGLDNNSE